MGIDSDKRVHASKGAHRPYNNEEDRFFFLESIKWIDKVVIFSTDDEMVEKIKENNIDILIVGSDWKGKKIIGEEYVTKVEFFDRIGTYSTTNILERK